METKICTKCKKRMDLSEFYNNKSSKDGKSFWCKVCMNFQNNVIQKKTKADWFKRTYIKRPKVLLENPKKQKATLQREARQKAKENGHQTTIYLKHKYGLTKDIVLAQLEIQGRVCAICYLPFKDTFDTVVDHCHKTLKFRGVLCRTCNTGLGMFRDKSANLLRAAEYLLCS